MSSHWTVQHTLDLLNRLKEEARSFAGRKQKREQDFHRSMTVLTNHFEEAKARQQSDHETRLGDTEARYQEKLQRIQEHNEARKTRIAAAHENAKATALERIENEEGRRKYQLQKGQLENERNRTQNLADNDTVLAGFKGALAENQQDTAALEASANQYFRAYPSLQRHLEGALESTEGDTAPDENSLLGKLGEMVLATDNDLSRFRRLIIPAIFRGCPIELWVVLLVVVYGGLRLAPHYLEITTLPPDQSGMICGGALAVVLALYFAGKGKAKRLGHRIANALGQARHLQAAANEKADARHAARAVEIQTEFETRAAAMNQEWNEVVQEAEERRQTWPGMMDEKASLVSQRNEYLYQVKLSKLREDRDARVARLESEAAANKASLEQSHEQEVAQAKSACKQDIESIEKEWKAAAKPLFDEAKTSSAEAARQFPDWQEDWCRRWTPPASFTDSVKFGALDVDIDHLSEGAVSTAGLPLPGPETISLPLFLDYPGNGSILIESDSTGNEVLAGTLNNLIMRLLSKSPPGRVSFTIIDPVTLGQNFAGVMHLADYEESLINRRIWTQPSEIDQQLANLNEQMEKVIQMFLRNEYETIADYNEQAGNIAEKYHFLVVADFPSNFSETAIRRLLNIAASGARCGVFTLIHWDTRQPLPTPIVLDDLRENGVRLIGAGNQFRLANQNSAGLTLRLDAPPSPDQATTFLKAVGESSKDSNRIEVPFEQVAPAQEDVWSHDPTSELRVPIGRAGATKLQFMALGKGTRQHALIAGKTGSGKSTLFHVMITNLALWCSPDQVEFYLVDFKKGVEFKCYAGGRLPHARVIAIESDREFGLSVLERVDEELRRRGDLFRELGVQDLAGYKRAGGKETIPRSLLIIDEFQEFFVEDDRISQGAALLLDRIVRQGRAFGMHVLLGSQTLGGAFTLARTTIGQMVVRIALQCNEADAYLIMDDNNPAPRLLSRPGEGIYNDMAGAIEGNSPFQTVWLSDEDRDRSLAIIRDRAASKAYPETFVFEGNAPSDVTENVPLQRVLASTPTAAPSAARLWLGSPNSIKGPTEAIFRRQAGNNLLMVGQRDEAVLAIESVGLRALAAQFPEGRVRFIVFDSTAPDSPQREYLHHVAQSIPHPVTLANAGDIQAVLKDLVADMKQRAETERGGSAPSIFVLIHGMQNFKKLRQEDDFSFSLDSPETEASPASLLNELIAEGAAVGIHLIVSCDTYNNINRFLPRKAISEFEMRVLFQMSANDSAALIDNPKASGLGLHRALFYNEHEGHLETFRPYALPDKEWISRPAVAGG